MERQATPPIQIAALTGGLKTPSARFRIRQYTDRLTRHGIVVQEHIPYFQKSCGWPSPLRAAARIPGILKSRKADAVWFNKELVQGYPTFERWLKRPRVLDVDDPIWLSLPLGRLAGPCIAAAMDTVIAGNSYVANYFDKYCSDIRIVPTGIDLNRYQQRNAQADRLSDKFVIGWTGLACNYKYLDAIADILKSFLDGHQNAELLLLSNRPWKTDVIAPERIRFIQWSPENEATTLHSMSVGIMPLTDTKWTRGKCSFKMLQYMAAGLPVIVSPVGMNADVLEKGEIGFSANSNDQWSQAFEALYNDCQLQIALGQSGRSVIERFYDADKIAEDLAGVFRSLV
jgi:glycosyltransferase involved in cell wall biosynthesis